MLRQSGGSILGNEARQNSKLREGLNLNFFNGKLSSLLAGSTSGTDC